MSLVVVILVVMVVVIYLRAQAKARAMWIAKVNLPGTWQWQQGDGQLALSGGPAKGGFIRRDGSDESSGQWQLRGHQLTLVGQGYEQALQLHFFKAGQIGLEDETGERRLYIKESSNVVPLNRH